MENGYELRTTATKGEGVFATRAFKAGETVMIATIETILDQNDSHATQIGEHQFARFSGLMSKHNHSCSPNCGVKVTETGAHKLVAIKDISIEEEITLDYAMRNATIDFFTEPCSCGSEKCRGKITGWKDLPADKKREYEGFVVPYLLEL